MPDHIASVMIGCQEMIIIIFTDGQRDKTDIDFSEIDVSCASYGAAIIAVDKSIRLI